MIIQSKDNPYSHLTIKDRKSPSLPAKALHERGMIRGKILDFGCGLGKDIEFLSNKGYNITGFDPYYAPEYPNRKYDTIICFYVLNILLLEEQANVLMAVSELLKPGGRAYFAVRRDIKKNGFRYNPEKEVYTYQCNVNLPLKIVFETENTKVFEYLHYTYLNAGNFEVSPFFKGNAPRKLVTESARAFAFFDEYPVQTGHTLVVPKTKVKSYFELDHSDQQACWIVVNRVKYLLDQQYQPDGFNIGINDGGPAGQTIEHAHIHVIPRFSGDIDNPRGGIRNIKNNLVKY